MVLVGSSMGHYAMAIGMHTAQGKPGAWCGLSRLPLLV